MAVPSTWGSHRKHEGICKGLLFRIVASYIEMVSCQHVMEFQKKRWLVGSKETYSTLLLTLAMLERQKVYVLPLHS